MLIVDHETCGKLYSLISGLGYVSEALPYTVAWEARAGELGFVPAPLSLLVLYEIMQPSLSCRMGLLTSGQ